VLGERGVRLTYYLIAGNKYVSNWYIPRGLKI